MVSSSVSKNSKTERTPTNGNERKAENSPAARDGKRAAPDDRSIRDDPRRRSANAGTKRVESLSLLGENADGTDLKPYRRRGRETVQKRGRMWTSTTSRRTTSQAAAHPDGKNDHSAILLPMRGGRRGTQCIVQSRASPMGLGVGTDRRTN